MMTFTHNKRISCFALASGRWTIVLVLLVWAVLVACEAPGDQDRGDAEPDVDVPDVIMVHRDAGPDAGPDAGDDACTDFGIDRTTWQPQPFCDATYIQTPALGDRYTSWVHVSDQRVVYAERRDPPSESYDIFLYDLGTCTELRISQGCGYQFSPSLWGSEVIFTQFIGDTAETRLFMFDTGNLEFTELHPGLYTSATFFNGRHVVMGGGYEIGDNSKYIFRWDLVTDDLVVLAGEGHAVEDISISLTHAAWVDFGGPGKDVFVADLESGSVHHIESTYDSYTAYTATWGDWVLWEDRRNEYWEIYGYRISTEEEVRLTDNGEYNSRPSLRHNLACWRTTYYSGADGWDLVVHDLETGVTRRVTQTPHPGYKCKQVDSGWLVYLVQPGGTYMYNEVHAIDLIAAGILDATGLHVLPE